MNATDQFFAATRKSIPPRSHPFPLRTRSTREDRAWTYRVPMREIAQTDTPASFGHEHNPPFAVYDTSGP